MYVQKTAEIALATDLCRQVSKFLGSTMQFDITYYQNSATVCRPRVAQFYLQANEILLNPTLRKGKCASLTMKTVELCIEQAILSKHIITYLCVH
jgi:hypothetical protein